MKRILVIEPPNQQDQQMPWNEETRKQFNLDPDDVECLEHGQIVFKLDVALSLEDVEE